MNEKIFNNDSIVLPESQITWRLAVSTKRNLYTEIRNCFGSNVFQQRVGIIDLDMHWGMCIELLERFLSASDEIVYSSPHEWLHVREKEEIINKRILVRELIKELMAQNIIKNDSITIQESDISEIFSTLYTFIQEVVKKHNEHVSNGKYGSVTEDKGITFWSTSEAIQ